MKSKIDSEQDITNITTTIHQQFPELSKYLSEMPENGVEGKEISIKNLEDYHKYSKGLIAKDARTHHKMY